MAKRSRGRPVGTFGTAVPFHPHDIQLVLKAARRERYAVRAEVLVMLSTTLGLRASQLAALTVNDIYESDDAVRRVISIPKAFLLGKKSQVDITELPRLRASLADYFEKQIGQGSNPEAPMFRSQKGGALTSQAIARYLTDLYRKAGIVGASSRSGRKTFARSS